MEKRPLWGMYGEQEDYGWEIDHALPESKGGTDHTENLRAMHWENNQSKSDNFLSYDTAVSSDGNKNIVSVKNFKLGESMLQKLKRLYPTNKYLQENY
ncbi:MAG: HNH endonuclease [Candidatus Symbiothrix sp.]|jgi:hypothetical protein|nr:HNH endonuclease [Candidatus Symbiothrix sp.]